VAPATALPNFFIAGAPKAGTTSLYNYLRKHPRIYMSPVKEPCYFASELRPENFAAEFRQRVNDSTLRLREALRDGAVELPEGGLVLEWDDYLSLFRAVTSQPAVGEASVCYLWSETAAANIVSRIPQAKIVMILRDPAERAFSHYLHHIADGHVRHSFSEHLDVCFRNTSREFSAHYPFLEYGLYFEQVRRYLNTFPAGNVQIYIYEQEWRQPGELLRELQRFLDVDIDPAIDTSRKNLERRAPRSVSGAYLLKRSGIWQGLAKLTPPKLRPLAKSMLFRRGSELKLEAKDRARLVEYYRDDVKNLARLIGRDLNAWLR
jgi:hypothetical protein